jgi:hypothetical protein
MWRRTTGRDYTQAPRDVSRRFPAQSQCPARLLVRFGHLREDTTCGSFAPSCNQMARRCADSELPRCLVGKKNGVLEPSRGPGYAMVVGAACCWGAMAILAKLLLRDRGVAPSACSSAGSSSWRRRRPASSACWSPLWPLSGLGRDAFSAPDPGWRAGPGGGRHGADDLIRPSVFGSRDSALEDVRRFQRPAVRHSHGHPNSQLAENPGGMGLLTGAAFPASFTPPDRSQDGPYDAPARAFFMAHLRSAPSTL